MTHKQSWHRTNKQDYKNYQESKLWDNIERKKAGYIKFEIIGVGFPVCWHIVVNHDSTKALNENSEVIEGNFCIASEQVQIKTFEEAQEILKKYEDKFKKEGEK